MAILFEPDKRAADVFLPTIGGDTTVVDSVPQMSRALAADQHELLLLIGPSVDLAPALDVARAQTAARPALGVILLRRRLDVSVLTEAMRAGVREVVQPDQLTAVSDAIRRSLEVSRRMVGEAGRRGGKQATIITVFSAKGGAGKTTVSTNLAAACADSGRHVCMLDLDLTFGDVGIVLQVPPQRTIADAIGMSGEIDETAVQSLMTRYRPGFDAILAPVTPGEAERVRPHLVGDVLATLRGMVDVVVVDTPPEFTEHVLTALDASDVMVLVATPDVAALKNLRLALETLDQLGYPREARRIVLNRADERVGLSVADVEKALEAPLHCRIPSNRDIACAFNQGVPLVLESTKHPVSKAIRSFVVDDVLKDAPPPATPPAVPLPPTPVPLRGEDLAPAPDGLGAELEAAAPPALMSGNGDRPAAAPGERRSGPKHRRGRFLWFVGGRR